jgi:hypothetical protein
MPAREYGKYLYAKHKDKFERLFLNYDMLVPEKEMENICSVMLHDIFKSVSHCIRNNVEVSFTAMKNSKIKYFTISYARRYGEDRNLETIIRRKDTRYTTD